MKHAMVMILLGLSLIFTIINVCNSIIHKTYVNLLGFAALAPIFNSLYQESDLIYKISNSIMSFVKNGTTRFKVIFYIANENDDIIKQVNKGLRLAIRDLSLKFLKGHPGEYGGGYYKGRLITNTQVEFLLEISNDGIPPKIGNIAVKLEFQISMRDVMSCWRLAKDFRSKFLEQIENDYPRVGVAISLPKNSPNPFYRLTFRVPKFYNIDNFELKFKKNRDLTVSVRQNEVYADTTHISDLDGIIAECIPFSNLI